MDKTRTERKHVTKDKMGEKHENEIFMGNSETKANFLKLKSKKKCYWDIKFTKVFFLGKKCAYLWDIVI